MTKVLDVDLDEDEEPEVEEDEDEVALDASINGAEAKELAGGVEKELAWRSCWPEAWPSRPEAWRSWWPEARRSWRGGATGRRCGVAGRSRPELAGGVEKLLAGGVGEAAGRRRGRSGWPEAWEKLLAGGVGEAAGRRHGGAGRSRPEAWRPGLGDLESESDLGRASEVRETTGSGSGG